MIDNVLRTNYREGEPIRNLCNVDERNIINRLITTVKGVGCRVEYLPVSDGTYEMQIVVDGSTDTYPDSTWLQKWSERFGTSTASHWRSGESDSASPTCYADYIWNDDATKKVVDLKNERLVDTTSSRTSVDWNDRLLYDSAAAPVKSVDWGSRKLYDDYGYAIMEWHDKTKVEFGTDTNNQFAHIDVHGGGLFEDTSSGVSVAVCGGWTGITVDDTYNGYYVELGSTNGAGYFTDSNFRAYIGYNKTAMFQDSVGSFIVGDTYGSALKGPGKWNKMNITDSGSSAGYYVAGKKIIGTQKNTISDISETGADQDGTARGKINSILAALRSHGLIAT